MNHQQSASIILVQLHSFVLSNTGVFLEIFCLSNEKMFVYITIYCILYCSYLMHIICVELV